MRTRLFSLVVLLSILFTKSWAQEAGMYYVYFSDGRVWGYPKEFVWSIDSLGGQYTITLTSDSIISWSAEEVDSIDETAPVYPQFTAFKLDDKLNDQLFHDVEAAVNADEVWTSVSGIGKYLTPTFEMDMPLAVAYVNGKEQVSKKSRLRFVEPVIYTLGSPNYQRLSIEKVSEEVWSYPEVNVEEISLAAHMLSTNAPTSRTSEGLGMMLDGDPNTIFHSTWSNDPVYPVDLSKQVYVSVALPKSLSEFQFYYQGRTDSNKYNVYEWKIEASNDGWSWDNVASINEENGLPTYGSGVSYRSSTIALGGQYKYLRFTAIRVGYKNYLCLSEFRIYEVSYEGEPELLQPAQYAYQMVPMGREVPVRIDWMTDYATSVPRIDINIDGGEMVSSKEDYLGAQITFRGNGVWNDYDFEERVNIKGRGNTSWSSNPYAKNPYRLKFDKKVNPFGMKKGKNWNLIAQKQTGSLMTNPVAHKIARMIGMQTANDAIPVDLYMNGSYRGSYYFTQKVGLANNNVDYEDESQAALFELDSYEEDGQFKSYTYKLPVNIKDPEFSEGETYLDYYGVREEFNRFETAVFYKSNYERFVDIDMLVRYMLINDLVLNSELGHPKSSFLSRENMNHMTSRYIFGPAWDFDWAYGYESTSSYCDISTATRSLFSYHTDEPGRKFFNALLNSSQWVQYHYYKLWEEFIDKHLDELIDFVDDYYAYARRSFVNNYYVWGDGYNYYSNVENMKSWLIERARHIKNSLVSYPAGAQEPFAYGDLDNNGVVDGYDMEYMQDYLFEVVTEDVSEEQADADGNGKVSLSDLTWVNLLVSDERAAQTRRFRRSVLWDDGEEQAARYDFDIEDLRTLVPAQDEVAHSVSMRNASEGSSLGLVVTESSGVWNVEVSLVNSTPYIAYAMDFVIPKSFTLPNGDKNITLSYRTEPTFVMEGRWVNDEVYRVIGYSLDNTAMTDAEGPLFTMSLNGTGSLSAGDHVLSVKNVCAVTENAIEELLGAVSVNIEVDESQLSNIGVLETSLCWPADVYDVHGRLVRKAASSLEGLSRGVYIVNNRKVVR